MVDRFHCPLHPAQEIAPDRIEVRLGRDRPLQRPGRCQHHHGNDRIPDVGRAGIDPAGGGEQAQAVTDEDGIVPVVRPT